MKPARPERDHKNRWCFRCETWRDMEPWDMSRNGCRCPTCGYVAKVANPFFETLKCSVCERMCEGVTDDKGRLGCSYECAHKIGHITREIMVQYAGRKWQPARSNRDAPVIGATEPTPTTCTVGETEWAHRIATLEHMLAEERENVDTLRARVAELEAEVAVLRPWSVMLKRAHGALTDAGCVVPLEFDQSIEHAIKDLANRATRAEQLFVDEYDARRDVERQRDELLRVNKGAAQHGIITEYVRELIELLGIQRQNPTANETVDAAATEIETLRTTVEELQARITTLEAMKP